MWGVQTSNKSNDRVEDIDETLRRASELGGRVIVPKSTLPDGDTMAVMIDPSGLSVALVASSRAE